MNRKRIRPAASVLLIACLAINGLAVAGEADWKEEFERICIQVESAAGLEREQLQKLVEDADRLLERLRSVEEPQVKIYRQRLKRCRDFFSFMHEAHQRYEAKADDSG